MNAPLLWKISLRKKDNFICTLYIFWYTLGVKVFNFGLLSICFLREKMKINQYNIYNTLLCLLLFALPISEAIKLSIMT